MKDLMKSILDSVQGIVENVDDDTIVNFNKTEYDEKEFFKIKAKKTVITIEIIKKI